MVVGVAALFDGCFIHNLINLVGSAHHRFLHDVNAQLELLGDLLVLQTVEAGEQENMAVALGEAIENLRQLQERFNRQLLFFQ